MLAEALLALAAAGGAAVAGAVATDAWEATRDGVGRLFGRRGKQKREVVLAELDRDALELEAAGVDSRELVRQELAERWRERLVELLDEDPEAADELQELVTAAEPRYTQNIVAREQGRAFGVQGGDLHYHEHQAAPGPDEAG